jgi:hypothetical protein
MGSSLESLVSHNFWTSELTAHKIDCTIPWTFSWLRYLCSNICKFSIQHREERSMSSSLVEMLKNWFINGILCNGCRCICRIVNLIVNIKFYCWAISLLQINTMSLGALSAGTTTYMLNIYLVASWTLKLDVAIVLINRFSFWIPTWINDPVTFTHPERVSTYLPTQKSKWNKQ